eukprot:TRINITY_DN8309_c0_g1_i6.p2 TRINITY_DN8309_c0_g1~~TRINITY_DN8309_c0_g1_i6.p2  ORF type:complete len:103 (-),score=18.14 TRINITY_DN8309_c0_g1_i6:112-420(-)
MRGGLYLAKAGLEYIGEGFDKSIYLVGVQSEKDTSLVFIAYLVIYYLLFELAPLAIVLVILQPREENFPILPLQQQSKSVSPPNEMNFSILDTSSLDYLQLK